MTNLELIEQECIKINKILLDSPTYRPNESSCKHCYVAFLEPGTFAAMDEYLNGDYDEIIDKYFNILLETYNRIEIEMGVSPTFSLEEFMGEAYKGIPLQTQDQLFSKIQDTTKSIKKLESNILRMPEELKEAFLKRENEKLTEVMLDVKLENYAKTPEEVEYLEIYNDYHMRYSDLFKSWFD